MLSGRLAAFNPDLITKPAGFGAIGIIASGSRSELMAPAAMSLLRPAAPVRRLGRAWMTLGALLSMMSEVIGMEHRLQMIRVDAASILAAMMENMAHGDATNQAFVKQPV